MNINEALKGYMAKILNESASSHSEKDIEKCAKNIANARDKKLCDYDDIWEVVEFIDGEVGVCLCDDETCAEVMFPEDEFWKYLNQNESLNEEYVVNSFYLPIEDKPEITFSIDDDYGVIYCNFGPSKGEVVADMNPEGIKKVADWLYNAEQGTLTNFFADITTAQAIFEELDQYITNYGRIDDNKIASIVGKYINIDESLNEAVKPGKYNLGLDLYKDDNDDYHLVVSLNSSGKELIHDYFNHEQILDNDILVNFFNEVEELLKKEFGYSISGEVIGMSIDEIQSAIESGALEDGDDYSIESFEVEDRGVEESLNESEEEDDIVDTYHDASRTFNIIRTGNNVKPFAIECNGKIIGEFIASAEAYEYLQDNYMLLDESLYEGLELCESKADQQKFIDKYGEKQFQRYNNIKNKINSEWVSEETGQVFTNPKDILQLTKQGDPDTIDELITYFETKGSNSDKRKMAKAGAKLVYDQDGDRIYRITTPAAMQYYGENTTWCIAGKYPGHRDEQLKWWDAYLDKTDGGYYVIITASGDKYCALYDSNNQHLYSIWNAYNGTGGNENVTNVFLKQCPEGIRAFFHTGAEINSLADILDEARDWLENDSRAELIVTTTFSELKTIRHCGAPEEFTNFLTILQAICMEETNPEIIYRKITRHFRNIVKHLELRERFLPESFVKVYKDFTEEQLQQVFAILLAEAIFPYIFNTIGDRAFQLTPFVQVKSDEGPVEFSCTEDQFFHAIELAYNSIRDSYGTAPATLDELDEHYCEYEPVCTFLDNPENGPYSSLIGAACLSQPLCTDALKKIYKYILKTIPSSGNCLGVLDTIGRHPEKIQYEFKQNEYNIDLGD